jgi:hypothetical protein
MPASSSGTFMCSWRAIPLRLVVASTRSRIGFGPELLHKGGSYLLARGSRAPPPALGNVLPASTTSGPVRKVNWWAGSGLDPRTPLYKSLAKDFDDKPNGSDSEQHAPTTSGVIRRSAIVSSEDLFRCARTQAVRKLARDTKYVENLIEELEGEHPTAPLFFRCVAPATLRQYHSRVRQLMKAATIEAVDAGADGEQGGGLVVEAMSVPESGGLAEMITGNPAAIAQRIAAILAARGIGAGVGR